MNAMILKECDVKIEDSIQKNPWSVDDASVFLKFCCPECDFQIPNLQMFSDHALENHIQSIVLFGSEKVKEKLLLKEEHYENEVDNDAFVEDQQMYIDDFSAFSQDETSLSPKKDEENTMNIDNQHTLKEEDSSFAKINESLELSIGKCGKKLDEYEIVQEPIEKLCNNPPIKNSSVKVVCDICNKQLSNERLLQKHKLTMHKETRGEKVACDLCDFKCEITESLKKHKVQKHQCGEYKSCSYCDYKNKQWDRLKMHIDAAHPEHGDKKHLCDLCGEGFIFEESCQRHKRNQHQKGVCHGKLYETF